MSVDTGWSEVEITAVRGQSVLTRSRSVQPLKLLNPRAAGSCHVVLSSYGGGLVAGDTIRLHLTARKDSRLLLGTQANTRIYRSPLGALAEQTTEGHLESGALAAVLPDPVVLQAGSCYRQHQHWHLAPGALLLLADWFHSGRMDSGEQFEFTSYESELRVSLGGKLMVLDRFAFRPAEHIASSPAHFGRHQTSLSIYLIGTAEDARFQRLLAALEALQPHSRNGLAPDVSGQESIVAVTAVRPGVQLLRALGTSRHALQPIYDHLSEALAEPELLGHHASRRKY